MRHRLTAMIAMILVFVMAFADPMRVLADSQPVYLSDVKVGMGKSSGDAEKALTGEGYTIVTDDKGNKVDFNNGAGGGLGSKGDRVVYIGYKTTTERDDAITDLALMNMKGGYSVEDYDTLMEGYISSQIIPFVDSFMAAIREYRENYNSANPSNKARAQYIHDVLNKYTDDDCNDAPLGDLLLNETKYEMGDAAYDALSAAEKAKHADLVTIIAQSNGTATLTIENLLVRASDTEETTWTQRLSGITYDDLLAETGLSLSKARKELDKLYYDDALKILDMWDTFREQLENYENAIALIEELQNKDYSDQEAIINSYDVETATDEETEAYMQAVADISSDTELLYNALRDVACREYLESVEYAEGGTLLDLFTLTYDQIEEDITQIYPVAASLSDGQRAGLELVTLEDLVELGGTDEDGYKDTSYDELEQTSIYDGVNRAIYEPGGVGLTSDAIRARALENLSTERKGLLSPLTYVMIGITGATAIAFAVTLGKALSTASQLSKTNQAIKAAMSSLPGLTQKAAELQAAVNLELRTVQQLAGAGQLSSARFMADKLYSFADKALAAEAEVVRVGKYIDEAPQYAQRLSAKSATCNKLAAGLGFVMILLVAFTTYLSWRDIQNHYKVDYTPIPRYMVDEKDITAYNRNGEKIVIKNQEAYYTAVTCNRSPSAEYYGVVNDIADLNGDVGQQWLAMYYAKNDAEQRILADSLKAVTGDSRVPTDYTTGVHMFGVGAAENFNNSLYVWNSDAKSVYLYFKQEEGAPAVTGTAFTAGSLMLSAGAGLGVGALVSGLAVSAAGKKKRKADETAEEA